MRALFALAPLAVLAACASPLERCLDAVDGNIAINARLIAQTEANIARGFAVTTRQVVRERNTTCRGVTESGEVVVTRCEEVDVRNRRVPVAIDLDAERAKLDSLQERRALLLRQRDAARAQCVAANPA